MGRRVLPLLAKLDRDLAVEPAEFLLQFAGELRFRVAYVRPICAAVLIDPEFRERRAHRLEQLGDRSFRSDLKNADGRCGVIGNLVSLGKPDRIRIIRVKQDEAEQMSAKDAAEQKEQELSREALWEESRGLRTRTSAAKT